MRTNAANITELQSNLDSALPDKLWLRMLEPFAPSGVADALHMRQAAGSDRDKFRRSLGKLESAGIGLPPIFRMLDHSIPRPGARGRAPTVYLLGDSGAALLRANGYPDAQPCGLSDDHAISHALAMLSIHQAAQQSGRTIHTDKYLPYGAEKHLRPDHRVILQNGLQLILEAEQAAVQKLIPRILESLSNKQAFFQSEESKEFLPEVRMLVNLPRGREWSRTLRVWREACNLVVQQSNAPLTFRLLVMPLDEFLNAPEWEQNPSARWEEISAVSRTAEETDPSDDDSDAIASKIEASRSLRDDCILLTALLEEYNRDPRHRQAIREPDPYFFQVVQIIYSASHTESRDIWQRFAFPHASVYLLRRYFEMHPALTRKLCRTIHYGKGRIRWNTTTVIHRMQQVINSFLAFHGWRSNGPLRVTATVGDWEGIGPFGIHVGKAGLWRFSDAPDFENEFFPAIKWILTVGDFRICRRAWPWKAGILVEAKAGKCGSQNSQFINN